MGSGDSEWRRGNERGESSPLEAEAGAVGAASSTACHHPYAAAAWPPFAGPRSKKHGLNGDSRAERRQHAPFVLGAPLLAHLIQHEDHRGAEHVAVLTEHSPAGRQLLWPELEGRVNPVHDPRVARVQHPEEVVPLELHAKRRKPVQETPLDIVPDDHRELPADSRRPRPPPEDGVLALGDDALRRRHDLEEWLLIGVAHGIGAHDDGAGAVAEEAVVDERLVVAFLLRLGEEQGGDELSADHQDARATVVLGQVLGEAQRRGAGKAAAEVEHGAAHGGAEAQEMDQVDVHAGGVRARVAGDDEVREVGGRPAPLGDRLPRRRRGEIRRRGLDDVKPRVHGRRGPVEQLGVGVQEVLVEVKEALLDG
ncbi:hypothetical protein U9M48_042500 [Paspalum notatum var. saurae]|uniref:Uncharacterized protein n=1 Tax=Paspalum notatum var. saurae TaxID=547442 RepID=A0AAQ3UV76_PASNO